MKKLLLTVTTLATFVPCAAFANNLAAVKGTLRNVETAIETAVKQAEKLYEQNGGVAMAAQVNALKTSGSNPYIDKLIIDTDYKVLFKFAGTKKGAKTVSAKVPVTHALLGKEIALLPMHNDNDARVSSWECLTNSDRDVAEFMNSSGTPEFSASFIRRNTGNPYLSMCIYVNQDLIPTT